jgi:biopolymer transport protein ExbB
MEVRVPQWIYGFGAGSAGENGKKIGPPGGETLQPPGGLARMKKIATGPARDFHSPRIDTMLLFAAEKGGGGGLIEAFGNFVAHDTFFAIIMCCMTLTAVSLVIWRVILNYNLKTDLNLFLPRFQEVLNKEGIDGALRFCKAQPASEVIPRKLFVAALENVRAGTAAMRRAMATVVELEILPDMNFLLNLILAIAKIATMIGLLGTVISMIGTFSALGKADAGGGQAQASAEIGLALFATAMGLLTAIPLVFMHVMFKGWIHKYELKMKNAAQKLLLLIQAAKSGTPVAPAAAGAAPAAAARPMAAPAARVQAGG